MNNNTLNKQTNGHQVNSVTAGEGPPVILIHGMASSLRNWDYLVPALADNGYQAHALDLLGHGESVKPADPGDYHAENLYAHFENWIEGLNLTEKPILVGHSMGAYISCTYAYAHPDQVRGLLLVDPFISPRQLTKHMQFSLRRPEVGAWALRAAPQWLIRSSVRLSRYTARQMQPEMRRQVALDFKRADPNILHTTATMNDLTPKLPEVEHPTLVIWGEKDQALSPASFPRFVDELPNAEGHPFPDTGHVPHLTRTEAFNSLALTFMGTI